MPCRQRRLDGGLGADTLVGGAGNDTYLVDDAGDVIEDTAGVDTVISRITFDLSREGYATTLEHLTLAGTAPLDGTGNSLANRMTGNDGPNTLDGGAGQDSLIGGQGDDTYVVDLIRGATANSLVLQDTITETPSQGNDTLRLRPAEGLSITAAVTLVLPPTLENYDASETGSLPLNLTGNTVGNLLTGNAADNLLNGGAGIDYFVGGLGNDTHVLDLGAELANVTELADEGTDTLRIQYNNATTVVQTISLTDNLSAIEHVQIRGTGLFNVAGNDLDNLLTGNGSANRLSGGEGNDTLEGGVGLDTLSGGMGNDSYLIDRAAELATIIEAVDEGIDTLRLGYVVTTATSVSLTNALANFENLTTVGAGTFNLTGNSLDNLLRGNTSNNTLNGGTGNDTLIGGGGRDTLTGGGGADIFGIDRIQALTAAITDFNSTDGDQIGLGSPYSQLFTGGTLNEGVFGTGTTNTFPSASTAPAQKLLYNTLSGALWYDRDGRGPGRRHRCRLPR